MIQKIVIIDFDLEGYHNYYEAPKEVDFLKYRHRHLFQFKVGFVVKDSDREIEIFLQEKKVKKLLIDTFGFPCEFKGMSCEMICEFLMDKLKHDSIKFAEVLEDGKGGSRLVYFPFNNDS